ncbi:MAG: tetratricopeptide repeat protein [Methylococcaceae bacterium]|nr:tetratricopeptide repeat protein [Methylococcaceae bacterium]
MTLSVLITACQSNPKDLTVDQKNMETSNWQSLFQNHPLLEASSVDEALKKARTARINGDIELAIAYYIKAFDLGPQNTGVLLEMADAYHSLGKPELVEVCYQMILKYDPANLDVLERYGLLMIKRNKPREAEELLGKASVLGTQSWKAYNGLGILSDMNHKHIEARNFYDLADAVDPNNPEVLNNKGYSLYMDDRLDEARDYFLNALRINPGFKKAVYNYALLKGRQRRYQDALAVFSRTLKAPEANNNTGYIALRNGDFEEAEFYLNRAIKLSPRFYPRAHENLRELEDRRIGAGFPDREARSMEEFSSSRLE